MTPSITLRRPIPGHRVHVFDRAAPGEGGGRRTRRGDKQPWGRGPRRSLVTDPTLRRLYLDRQPAGEPWWSPSTHTPCLREHALRGKVCRRRRSDTHRAVHFGRMYIPRGGGRRVTFFQMCSHRGSNLRPWSFLTWKSVLLPTELYLLSSSIVSFFFEGAGCAE